MASLFSFRISRGIHFITNLCAVQAYSARLGHDKTISPFSFNTWSRGNNVFRSAKLSCILSIRGGNEEKMKGTSLLLTPLLSTISYLGDSYVRLLETKPIIVKSITAGIIFGLSDTTAQILESSRKSDQKGKLDKNRLLASILVGLLYFGPAAHKWYEWIFKVLPETSVASNCYKAALGQLIFSPCFTCVFFAVNLVRSGDFTMQLWLRKIQKDLFGMWTAGLGYWPIVSFISYAFVPAMLIPLFSNLCSFIWTVYVSLVTNAKVQTK